MTNSMRSMVVLATALGSTFGMAGVASGACPANIYLVNNAGTTDGMRSNGGYPGWSLSTSQITGSGLTCTYSRPNDPGYDAFIGRNLQAGESSATLLSSNSWRITKTDGSNVTVTCPTRIALGPVTKYGPAGGGLTDIPSDWLATQNGVQAVPFSRIASGGTFALQCNYSGFSNITVYIPPTARGFSAASCPGMYAAGASLSTRLASCAGLDDLLLWEDGAGNVTSHSGYSHPAWTDQQKVRLDQLFSAMQPGSSNLGIDCPVPAMNFWATGQSNDANGNPVRGTIALNLFFTANQAFDTYAAQVAWIFYVEVNHLVPWSIFSHPASELVELFDSRRYHTRFVPRSPAFGSGYSNLANYPTNIREGRDFWNASSRGSAAWEAVCDPRVGYQFLSGLSSNSGTNLLGPTEQATLKNITWWFYQSVGHGDAADASPSTLLSNASFYLSDRLVARSDAYFSPTPPPRVIANKGCHSAANLFYDLAKSVNIPLLHVASTEPDAYAKFPQPPIYMDYARHSGLVYGWGSPSTTLVVHHVDDMYANYGAIFPIDSNGQPVTDPAQALYSAVWLRPAQLTAWNYRFTNDWRLQSWFSTYGNRAEMEVGTQGILAGYWLPSSSPYYANSTRFAWYNGQLLCGLGAGQNVMMNWCNRNPVDLQSAWTGGFGASVLQSANGSFYDSAADYIGHLQSCAQAYSGLSTVSAACASFSSAGPYYTALKNRTATSSWTGTTGK